MVFGKLKQKFQNENGEENVPDVYRLYDNASVNIKNHVGIVERRVKEMQKMKGSTWRTTDSTGAARGFDTARQK